MRFDKFEKKIIKGLRKIYGGNAEIGTGVVMKNNGSKYNGVHIMMKDSECRTAPVVDLDSIYEAFERGKKNLEGCILDVYHQREALKSPEGIEQLAEKSKDWERVKDKIYPILLSTEENKELLQNLVSRPLLDLSVAYVIREDMSERCAANIKISEGLLRYYGVDSEQLHEQAMKNLEGDGYEFQDLAGLVRKICQLEALEEELGIGDHGPEMYILTNESRSYGAAGILNRKILKEFAGDRDFLILPSSIHETLFVPVNGEPDQEYFDTMVREINRTDVCVEERLADHSYYYDAAADEIRMCAGHGQRKEMNT